MLHNSRKELSRGAQVDNARIPNTMYLPFVYKNDPYASSWCPPAKMAIGGPTQGPQFCPRHAQKSEKTNKTSKTPSTSNKTEQAIQVSVYGWVCFVTIVFGVLSFSVLGTRYQDLLHGKSVPRDLRQSAPGRRARRCCRHLFPPSWVVEMRTAAAAAAVEEARRRPEGGGGSRTQGHGRGRTRLRIISRSPRH